MIRCLTSARFNMKADILRQSSGSSTPTAEGSWEDTQDPITGEIIRKWIPIGDDPNTPENEGTLMSSFPCMARGIIDGGIRVAGTTERWGETYVDIDYCRIEFPANTILTKRDRVTNIRTNLRNRPNRILWLEEELEAESGVFRSTVFNVLGVTPVIDPFGNHTSNVAMLERASVQQNG